MCRIVTKRYWFNLKFLKLPVKSTWEGNFSVKVQKSNL